LATNQLVEFLSRVNAANQSTGRVSLPGLGIVVVGYQTKHPSWFLHRMVQPRPPNAYAQGAKKNCRLPITPLMFLPQQRRNRDCGYSLPNNIKRQQINAVGDFFSFLVAPARGSRSLNFLFIGLAVMLAVRTCI
jgi:hypothetical protein